MSLAEVHFELEYNGTFRSVEIDKKTSFSMNFRQTDLTNPTATKIPFSNVVSLPRTRSNDALFDHIWKIDWDLLNFDPSLKVNFRLHVGANYFQSGYIQLVSIPVNPQTYEIRLYGGLGDYFYLLADTDKMKLTDLKEQFGSFYDHEIKLGKLSEYWSDTGGLKKSWKDYALGTDSAVEEVLNYAMTYQGEYDNFDSKLEYLTHNNKPTEVTWKVGERHYTNPELDEHRRSGSVTGIASQFFGEYRSYYQKPMIRFKPFFNKILERAESFGWKTKLDTTFFNKYNPYWENLWIILPGYDTESDATGDVMSLEGKNVTYNSQTDGSRITRDVTVGQLIGGIRYDISANIPFRIKAKVAGGSGIGASMSLSQSGTGTGDDANGWQLMAYLFINGVQQGVMSFREGGATLVVLNRKYVAEKQVENFPTPNDQSFYYAGKYGEHAGDKDYLRNSPDGTLYTLYLPSISYTPAGNESVMIRFEFSKRSDTSSPGMGGTVWRNTGGARQWKGYSATLEFTEEAAVRASSDPGAGVRTDKKVTFSDIIRSNQSCYDFLMSYCKIFGMFFMKDINSRTVTIMTRNSYFGKLERLDWTDKVDYGKGDVIEPLPSFYKTGIFKWKDTGSKYEEEYRAEYGREYGSMRFNTGYEFSDEEKEYLSGMIFSNCVIATPFSSYYFDRNTTLFKDNKIAPYTVDESNSSVSFDFMLVFKDGLNRVTTPFLLTDDSSPMLQYGYAWNSYNVLPHSTYPKLTRDWNSGDNDIYSLNFGNPAKVYNDLEVSNPSIDTGNSSLYNRFWRGYLSDRFRSTARYKTVYVHLTPVDMQYDLFNKFIVLNNTLWVIDRIDGYNPLSSDPTKVSLLSVYDMQNYISQEYIQGDLKITNITTGSNGPVIYQYSKSSNNANPVIVRAENGVTALRLRFEFDPDNDWAVSGELNSNMLTVSPLGYRGTSNFNITLTPNTAGLTRYLDIPIRWGCTTTVIRVVQVGNWEVSAISVLYPDGSALSAATSRVNGYASVVVTDNSTVSFTSTATAGYGFAYWELNGQKYYDQNFNLAITEDVTAVAFWYRTSEYVRLSCSDANTAISGHGKFGNFWLLPVNVSYTFLNSQAALSGYLFSSSSTYTAAAASLSRTITAADTLLTVYYSSVLLNVTVTNNSTLEAFPITLVGIRNSSGAHQADLTGGPVGTNASLAQRVTAFTFASGQTYAPYVKQRPDYHLVQFNPVSITAHGVHMLTVTASAVGWNGRGDGSVTLANGVEQKQYNVTVYGSVAYTLSSSNTGVLTITAPAGSSTTAILDIKRNETGSTRTFSAVQAIGGYNYTYQITQPSLTPPGWEGTSDKTIYVTVPATATQVDKVFYHNGDTVSTQSTTGSANPVNPATTSNGSQHSTIRATFPANTSTSVQTVTVTVNRTGDGENYQLVITQEAMTGSITVTVKNETSRAISPEYIIALNGQTGGNKTGTMWVSSGSTSSVEVSDLELLSGYVYLAVSGNVVITPPQHMVSLTTSNSDLGVTFVVSDDYDDVYRINSGFDAGKARAQVYNATVPPPYTITVYYDTENNNSGTHLHYFKFSVPANGTWAEQTLPADGSERMGFLGLSVNDGTTEHGYPGDIGSSGLSFTHSVTLNAPNGKSITYRMGV